MNKQTSSSEIASQALATLNEALQAGQSETLTSYLRVMARFRKYSWTNCLLISIQRPSATYVAGFQRWQELGHHVRKGEKGIAILAPVLCKARRANNQSESANDGGEATAERRLVAFRKTYVWDVEQTEGEALPEFATVKGDPQHHLDSLKAYVTAQGIALDYNADIAPAKGVSQGGKITLLPNMASGEEFSTLVHEASHERMHRSERRTQTTKTIRETEAEAVAFVVCHAIGLDTNTASVDYINLYAGDAATLSASLQLIQSTAAEILTALQGGEDAAE